MYQRIIQIILIAISSVFQSMAQMESKFIYNWKLNSFGIAAYTANAQFFRPLTLDYIKQVSTFDDNGNTQFVIDETKYEKTTSSLLGINGLLAQIGWMNENNNDEIKFGISSEGQEDVISYKRSFADNNTTTEELLEYKDEAEMIRINVGYYKSITPFWKFLKFYAGISPELNFSISTKNKITERLSIHDSIGNLITPFDFGNTYGYKSKQRIFFGANIVVGTELNINKWIVANKEKFGIGIEYGIGTGIQQLLIGKTYGKYRQCIQISVRYFLH